MFDFFFSVCCVYPALMPYNLFIFMIYLRALLVIEWHITSNSSEEWPGRV
jgi:hypothetical protein